MKRLLCLLAAVMLLVGCSAPRLRTGYYTASLEETDSMPFYFCLESGGEGYLHAMGQEIPVQWTEAGLLGDFSDCIPTREGGIPQRRRHHGPDLEPGAAAGISKRPAPRILRFPDGGLIQ